MGLRVIYKVQGIGCFDISQVCRCRGAEWRDVRGNVGEKDGRPIKKTINFMFDIK